MRAAWRWFGPNSGESLDAARQAGAAEIVSALHEVPNGRSWTRDEVAERKQLIEANPSGRSKLSWTVVESIPIPEAVKLSGGRAKQEIDAWIASLRAVAENDIRIVCYNFMPVVDWIRTDINHVTPTGATALRFDFDRFSAFDLFVLKRKGASDEYSEDDRERAHETFKGMSDAEIRNVTRNIANALPGSTTEPATLAVLTERIDAYRGLSAERLRQNLIEFLSAVVPIAEEYGAKLTLHPDDPPVPLFGVPRIASTESDYSKIFAAVPSPSNGMCLCTGSLGVRADNDLRSIARRFASRIHFAHLRATTREEDSRSFYEAAHLDGDVDMVAVVKELVVEERRRRDEDQIVFRPDHGQRMLDDLEKEVIPGYPVIGRLRGLAEIRGVIRALEASPAFEGEQSGAGV